MTVDRTIAEAYEATYRGPQPGAVPNVDESGALGPSVTPALIAAQQKLAHRRRVGETLVEVHSAEDPGGFGPALQVVTDQATMLMDSVTVLLHRLGVGYVALMHPALRVHRDVDGTLLRAHPGSHVEYVPNVTEGQACSAWAGMAMMNDQMKCDLDPVTFGSCDFGSLYDTKEYERLLSSPEIDVIVWGIRGYANAIRNPSSYGWIEAKENRILSISVKSPLSSVNTDPITLGTFTFRRASDFEAAYTRLIERQGKVNGEYYLDSCINDAIDLGLNCHLFEVDYYFCWGTPSDLHTFEYWQSCFHKWSSHPYKLERDSKVSSHQIAALSHKYRAQRPSIPDAKSQPRI